jgi:hypothetical protein
MKKHFVLLFGFLLFSGCGTGSTDTVYNPKNIDYYNYIDEPDFEYTVRYDDHVTPENIFYVAPDGSDEAAGSIGDPWATIQKAINTISPGQKVYVREGVYSEVIWINNSGKENNPVILSAYPGEKVIIDGSAFPRLVADTYWGMINATYQNYLIIRGFKIRNAHCAGIVMDNSNHITIEDNLIYNTLGSGIISYWGDDIKVEYNEIILACNLHMFDGSVYTERLACIQECLTVAGADVFSIAFNKVHHNGYPIKYGGEGIDAKAGSCHGRIYSNTVHDLNKLGIYVDSYGYTNDIDVNCNLVYNCNDWGICIAAESNDLTENIRIFNNIVTANRTGGIGVENWGLNGIHPLKDIYIYNNSILNNGRPDAWGVGIHIDAPNADNVQIYNNLIAYNKLIQIQFCTLTTGNARPTRFLVDHNLIFQEGSYYSVNEEPGTNQIRQDPLLINPYGNNGFLNAGSPALGNADVTRFRPGSDFYGNPRPVSGAFDIGAVEYN